jgi:hypothetical protein
VITVAKEHNFNVYLNADDRILMEEAKAVGKKVNIPAGRLMLVALRACMPTFKKELPKKRSFKINGMEVTP